MLSFIIQQQEDKKSNGRAIIENISTKLRKIKNHESLNVEYVIMTQ
jgi:hypothetical protein